MHGGYSESITLGFVMLTPTYRLNTLSLLTI